MEVYKAYIGCTCFGTSASYRKGCPVHDPEVRAALSECANCADLRRQLKDEHDCQERFAIRVLGQEEFDNSPCQAHPLELIEYHINDLRRQLEEAHGECENWKDCFERITKQLTEAKAYNAEWIDRCRRFRKQDADEYERQLETAKLEAQYAMEAVANLHKEVAELREEIEYKDLYISYLLGQIPIDEFKKQAIKYAKPLDINKEIAAALRREE